MGRNGHDSQHIPGHKELLIEEEKLLCKGYYLHLFRQKHKITLTLIKALGYLST